MKYELVTDPYALLSTLWFIHAFYLAAFVLVDMRRTKTEDFDDYSSAVVIMSVIWVALCIAMLGAEIAKMSS